MSGVISLKDPYAYAERMTLLLIPCLLAAIISGFSCGRKLTVAQHQGVRRYATESVLMHSGITVLTLLYGLFLKPPNPLWPALMLMGSFLGLVLGHWWMQRNPPRELSTAQLRTDAILEN